MAEIFSVTLPDGSQYDLKDQVARDFINEVAFKQDTTYGPSDIISFNSNISKPVKNLKVNIEPVQDLHGYDNPWPSGGWKNLLDESAMTEGQTINASGEVVENENYRYTAFYIPVITGTSYSFRFNKIITGTRIFGACFYDSSKQLIGSRVEVIRSADIGLLTGVITAPNTAEYMRVMAPRRNDSSELQIESGSTATSYAPYSNICPISGWTGCNVTRTGFNVWDEEWRNGYYSSSSGNFVSDSSYVCCKNRIRVVPNTKYYVNITFAHVLLWYDGNDAFIGPDTVYSTPHEYTAPANARYMRFYVVPDYGNTYKHDITINYPSTDHDYHPGHVQTIPITFPSGTTVYGGTLDVTSGVLTVDRAMVDLGTLTWDYQSTRAFFYADLSQTPKQVGPNKLPNALCSMYKPDTYSNIYNEAATDKSFAVTNGNGNSRFYVKDTAYTDTQTFTTAMSGQTAVYELAQPTSITLTPTEIETLLGQNNIWTDCGQITLIDGSVLSSIQSQLSAFSNYFSTLQS